MTSSRLLGPLGLFGLLGPLGSIAVVGCAWPAAPCTAPATGDADPPDPADTDELAHSWGFVAIRAPEAIERLRAAGRPSGGAGVIVAISDAGVDFTHPDLAHARHCGEHARIRGRDDTSRYRDPHGTHVAGIVAAAHDGAGVRGVAPDSRLLVADERDWFGFLAAAEAGAGVVNISWAEGAHRREGRPDPRDLETIREAVHAAVEADAVLVASIGQAPERRHGVPFGFSRDPVVAGRILGVGSVDAEGGLWSLGCGDSPEADVEHCLVAPGVDVLSPAARHLRGGPRIDLDGRDYYEWSGTSMAAPYVAGAAAVLRAAYPEADATQIAAALLDSAAPMHAPGEDVDAPSPSYGRGMLDLAAAVELLDSRLAALSAPPAPPA